MPLSRRSLIKASPAALLGAVAAPSFAAGKKPAPLEDAITKALFRVEPRAEQAYIRRVKAAGSHLLDVVDQAPQVTNTDQANLPGFVGNFSKTLQHNDLGEVDPSSYELLVDAVERNDYSGVQLSPMAQRKLANPSASQTFDVHGMDAHATRIDAAPSLTSAHGAAEMVEVYWQALTRDVPFADYSQSAAIADAIADMNLLSHPIGPRSGGQITPATIFRGSTSGDLDGPYISQLLLQPFNYGAGRIEQKYNQPVAGSDFMTDFAEYLAIQNGAAPARGEQFEATPRYIQTARDLANYVHNDVLFQAYYNGAMIMLGMGGAALSDENPFSSDVVEGGFVTFGGPDILNMTATAARMALTGAWFQKWRHMKLRPEAFGARVDVQRNGLADYGLHADVMASEAVARTVSAQGNALLGQAFPEGSPTHPAYPAGHACVAGACATVLKAWFRESMEYPNPMVPSADGTTLVPYSGPTLTLGGEINKLANNISIGRNAAGVHYRTDGELGMLAGEQQAIGLLKDYSLSYSSQFDGFRLTRFDGTTVQIVNGKVNAV